MDQSIFNLIENPNDLPSSNENMAEMYYKEILPTRDVTDNATQTEYNPKFGGTNISIRWDMDNQTWWIPGRSYIKLDVELTKAGLSGDQSSPLVQADQIAPNMGMAASVFNRMQVKMNDVTLSQISQFIPQCDTIAKRVYNSQEWLDKTNGQSSNFWNAYQKRRVHDVSSDGDISDYFINERVNEAAAQGLIVSSKSELGLGNVINGNGGITTALDISVNQTATFTGLNGFVVPDFQDEDINTFEPGDILLLTLRTAAPATEAFKRIWIVLNVTGANTLLLSQLNGIVLGGAIGNNGDGGYDIVRYRHRESITLLPKVSVFSAAAATNAVVANTGVHTIAAGTYSSDQLSRLDVVNRQLVGNAGQQVAFLFISQINGTTTYQGATSDLLAADIVAANVDLRTFKFSEAYDFESGGELGYTQLPAQNNAHSYTVTAEANGMLFTQTLNAAADALPDVNDIWQVGDWILLHFNGNNPYRWLWVAQVDPDGTTNTLLLYSSQIIAADFGVGNDGRDYVLGRARYNGQNGGFVAADSINIAKAKSRFDVCWKPSCLSIFNYPGAIPGGTKFELELQAESTKYVGLGIETPFGVQKAGRQSADLVDQPADYQLLVKNVKFYVCTTRGPAVGKEEYQYYINLNEIRTHKRKVQSLGLTQTSLDVMPSSYALALAFQDSRAIDSARTDQSVTKFTVSGDNSHEELALRRYSIRFAGISLPQPDADIAVGSSQDFINNQYIRNQLYTNQYFKNAGGESIEEWKERGIYFYHPFIRSAGNKESRAYIITQFNSSTESNAITKMSETGLNNLQSFLFEFYRAFALVKMKNGFVYSVQTANQ